MKNGSLLARSIQLAASLLILSRLPVEGSAQPARASVSIRVLRTGEPVAGLVVALTRESYDQPTIRETNAHGTVFFLHLAPGRYLVSVGPVEQRLVLSSELESVVIDLDAPSIHAGRFGRSTFTAEELQRLPHAGTVSTVLEMLEPVATTNRIDVAGIEGGIEVLWSARGSSWTQNRILLDGADITDPSGGVPLLYPDIAFYEEISLASAALGTAAAGPGAELQLATRSLPSSFGGSAAFRYSGGVLQSSNLDERLAGLGVEPREMVGFPSARIEVGTPRFYGAVNGFELSTRMPRFDREEKTALLGLTGKLSGEWGSLLGIAQLWSRPTFGARPGLAPEATVEARERFQVAQASLKAGEFIVMGSFARGELESTFSGTDSPLRDLATGQVRDAPLRVTDRTRARWTGAASRDGSVSNHLLRAGVEWSHAVEDSAERVPGDIERLSVDGEPHAVSFFSGSGEREVALDRFALHLQDAFFFDVLRRAGRLAPGLRLEWSRSGPIRWTSLSGNVSAGLSLDPLTEIHFSFGRYPHLLTSRLRAAAEGGLSWIWRRWTDRDSDRRVSPAEIGEALRRGGTAFTSIEESLPRPYTHELTVGVEKRFRRGFLRFSGYHRWEKRLLQTVNAGIAPGSYQSFLFPDVGVDGVPGTSDDNQLTIFDQKEQLGEDLFLLTHPPGLESFSQGLELLLGFDGERFSWQLSGRAYRDVGSGNVGNEAFQNDSGVLGDLLDDPNTLTHAQGRLFFDRAFTGKLALTARAPRELRLGAAVRYWDGQPFARHLFFPQLGQGFIVVQALPRGRQRYAFNMTVDLRVEREFQLGATRLSLAADVFNLFNQTLETEENVRSGEHFREPTAVQPARTIALEGRWRF